jgi:hypothetical protein
VVALATSIRDSAMGTRYTDNGLGNSGIAAVKTGNDTW